MATFEMLPAVENRVPRLRGPTRLGALLAAGRRAVAETPRAQWRYIVVAYLVVLMGTGGGWLINSLTHPSASKVVQGISVFAPLYVVAQALERLLEPWSNWTGTVLGGVKAPTDDAIAEGDAKQAPKTVWGKARLKTRRAQAIKAALDAGSTSATRSRQDGGTDGHAENAAATQAAVEQCRLNSAVLLWGIASGLAILVAASVGLTLLTSVGVQGAPVMLDAVVTGLAIGGGTKPLHDLISSLQTSKEAKQDPAQVKTV